MVSVARSSLRTSLVAGLVLLSSSLLPLRASASKPLWVSLSKNVAPQRAYGHARAKWRKRLERVGGAKGLGVLLDKVESGKKLKFSEYRDLKKLRKEGKKLRCAAAIYSETADLSQVRKLDRFLKRFGKLKDSLRPDDLEAKKAVRPNRRSRKLARQTQELYRPKRLRNELDTLSLATGEQLREATRGRIDRVKLALAENGNAMTAERVHDVRKDLFDLLVLIERNAQNRPGNKRVAKALERVERATTVLGRFNDALEKQERSTGVPAEELKLSLGPELTTPIRELLTTLER